MSQQHPQHGVAVASLVLGILSVIIVPCCGLLSFPLGLTAAILGGLALFKAQSANMHPGSVKPMAIAGIVLGSVSVVLMGLFMALGVGSAVLQELGNL